ncbi:MAG: CotH kinase family protein [Bacteroidota bacterium]
MLKKLFILFLITCPAFTNLHAQYQFPDSGMVFDDSEVPRVDIFIDKDSLDVILDSKNFWRNDEYRATFTFTTSKTVETVENVGFRLRGNTSRGAFKKSFKISFNTFEKGRDFHGLEKMNLNGEHNDPSIMRSKLCWDLCRWAGIPGSRANHVQLYINGEYRGLYINVEHIDEEFVQKRMTDGAGNLYKCLWPADLHFLGANPNFYESYENNGRKVYDLKTNLEKNDYSDLAHFINVLNNYSGTTFQCELEKIFDVDTYLKVIALDVLIGNWDGPIINKNNFYLYHDPCTGKFTYLPYDLDNTLGIDWFRVDWADTDIYNWSAPSKDYRPIYEKIMAVPEYKDRFTFYMEELLSQFFNNDFLDNYLDTHLKKLSPYRQNDTYAKGDYGWNFADFEKSFEEKLGSHVKYGLKEYIAKRHKTATAQLEKEDVLPLVKDIAIDWSENLVQFEVQTFDDVEVTDIVFHYQIGTGNWQQETLAVNAMGIGSYEYVTNEVAEMTYYVEVKDNNGQSRAYPLCQDATLQLGYLPRPQVVINEFMAGNGSSLADEYGEYDDWIEIYNAGDVIAPIHRYFLSDDPENPTKWQMPNTILNPGQYLLVWADDSPEQGANHTNFKLNKSGETIGLYDAKSNHYAMIDEITFPEQTTDISYARIPNGSGDFENRDLPTPLESNETSVAIEEIENADILVYPNPAKDFIRVVSDQSTPFDLVCLDLNGVERLRSQNTEKITVDNLPNGIYFLKVMSGQEVLAQKKVVVLH